MNDINTSIITGNISSPTLNGTIPSTSYVLGTDDYEQLHNKPQINSVEIIGNKTADDYNLVDKDDYISNEEIDDLFQ